MLFLKNSSICNQNFDFSLRSVCVQHCEFYSFDIEKSIRDNDAGQFTSQLLK